MKYLLQLGRYNYPTGGFLLMWPCFWGVFYELNYSTEIIKILILFFIGSFVMRGAGCCINDLLDKDIDKKVSRTRKRPLVTKKIKRYRCNLVSYFSINHRSIRCSKL